MILILHTIQNFFKGSTNTPSNSVFPSFSSHILGTLTNSLTKRLFNLSHICAVQFFIVIIASNILLGSFTIRNRHIGCVYSSFVHFFSSQKFLSKAFIHLSSNMMNNSSSSGGGLFFRNFREKIDFFVFVSHKNSGQKTKAHLSYGKSKKCQINL